ncbi:MAG: hypothetical protein PUJ51_15290 [Clostridiales bacterium]|uniref:hypothetical protein n=1 Tax=Terrisporobacter sp. TaxID=1965305 RepID=UPI002A4FCF2F|nr:hypothetical protein [Terrisporobacter sp.]MDD7755853.1 hypothetical protein [Clostridiales bacterium]MDY4136178.1 hypothetical protein [Terrisporobacter sp.]
MFKNKIYNPTMNKYYVYVLEDKQTHEILYCGKGKIEQRFSQRTGKETVPYNRMKVFNGVKRQFFDRYKNGEIDVYAIVDNIDENKEALKLETKITEILKSNGQCKANKFNGSSVCLGIDSSDHPCAKKIYCETTDEYFGSEVEPCRKYGLCKSNISKVLHNERKHTKGYVFKYV